MQIIGSSESEEINQEKLLQIFIKRNFFTSDKKSHQSYEMNILAYSKGNNNLCKRFYKVFPLAKSKEIKRQNILQVTHLGNKVEATPESKKKETEIAPTGRIIGLNFPVEKHAEYYKNQGERRASIAACQISPESSFLKKRYLYSSILFLFD